MTPERRRERRRGPVPGDTLRSAQLQRDWALNATTSDERQSSSYLSDIIAFEVSSQLS